MLRYMLFLGHKVLSYEVVVLVAMAIGFSYFSLALLKLNIKKWQIVFFVLLGFAVKYFMAPLIPFIYQLTFGEQAPWLNEWNKLPFKSVHGAGPLMIAFTIVCIKVFKWPAGKVLDHGAIALIMASSIARIGCFLNGCSGGKPCDLPWAIIFPNHPEVRVHPAQIYMLFLETMLWLFLIFFNRRKRYDGQTFWVGVLMFSIYKIGIEFVRDNPIFILGLTHKQVFTVCTSFLAVWVLRSHKIRLDKAKSQGKILTS